MKRQMLTGGLMLVTSFALAAPAAAGPVLLGALTELCVEVTGGTRTCETKSTDVDPVNAIEHFTETGTWTSLGGSTQYQLSSSGDASLAALKAISDLQIIQGSSDVDVVGWRTYLGSRDELVVDAPGLTGTQGTMWLTMDLSGSGTGTGSGGPGVQTASFLDWYAGPVTSTPTYSRLSLNGGPVSTTLMSPTPIVFTFGTPFDIMLRTITLAGAACTGAGCEGWSADVLTDSSHTAKLSGIAIQDASGNDLSSFSIVALSGSHYDAEGITVPEPGTFVLFGSGLAGMALASRFRRARARRS
jgi:hypothetical protein